MIELFQDCPQGRREDGRADCERTKARKERPVRASRSSQQDNRRLSMNRRTTLAALVIALSLGALPLLAHGSGGGSQPGQQRMGGPGRGGPGGPLPGLGRLDLSDAQREQL